MDISRALLIDGWMTEAELRWLAMEAQGHRRIVELGSFLGRSTRALCDNTPGWVLAVDDWYGPREVEVEKRSTLLDQFKGNLQGVPCELRIMRAKHDSIQVLETVAKLEPDMVFLDGDHDSAPVYEQVSFFSKRLKPGSLLCGHDAHAASVYLAIFGARGAVNIAPNTEIWHERI